MKMPENIQSFILNKCKEGNCILTLQNSVGQVTGQLEFDEEGMSKTLTEKFSVVGYINRMVTYSKKDIRILINDILIDQLPVTLEHKIDASYNQR